MDPVTAIGLIASVAQLVHATAKVIKIIHEYKHGNKHLTKLAEDLTLFSEALGGFDRVLRSRATQHQVSGEVISNVLESSLVTVHDLDGRVTELAEVCNSALRRAKWVQSSPKINRLHGRLKEQITMLQTFLSITHAETFLAVASNYPQYLAAIESQAENDVGDNSTIDTMSPTSPPGLSTGPKSMPEQAPAVAPDYLKVPAPLSRRNSVASSIQSDVSDVTMSSMATGLTMSTTRTSLSLTRTTSDDVLSATKSEDERTRQSLVIRSQSYPSVLRTACRYNCYCECHETPKRTGFGKLRSGKSRCTDPECVGNETQQASHIGSPTRSTEKSKSFLDALSEVMAAKSIKVRYPIHNFRMIDVGTDASRAIKQGDLDRLKMTIQSGESTIWDTTSDGWSLLHIAAYHRRLPIVKYLLGLGAYTEVGDFDGRKPADLAILKLLNTTSDNAHERELVEIFSQKDDYMLDFEFTPIHIAALDMYDITDRERPSLKSLVDLVDDANNAPPDTDWSKWKAKYKNRSPLFGAIIEYYRMSAAESKPGTKIIHNLLDHADAKYQCSPLHWAAGSGRSAAMITLVQHGADPLRISGSEQASILHAAAESKSDSGIVTAIDLWRRAGGDPAFLEHANNWRETALHVACWTGGPKIKHLLDAGADPSAREESDMVPLHCAGLSAHGPARRQAVEALCAVTPSLHVNAQSTQGRTPIFELLDDAGSVEVLLAAGARVDLVDEQGRNVLHHACAADEVASLRTILHSLLPDQHSTADLTGPSDKTRRTEGSEYRLQVIRALRTADEDGNSPLMRALRASKVESALLLLSLPGEILQEAGDSNGWAPVHHAARIGHVELMEVCIAHHTFIKGSRTADGKKVEVVAMEAGTWTGSIRDIVRGSDYF